MDDHRRVAKYIGILFLLAMVSSLVGGSMIEAVVTEADKLADATSDLSQVNIGAILEIINALSVMGIAVLMFSVLRKYDRIASICYTGFRSIEAVICFVAALVPLIRVSFNKEFLEKSVTDTIYFESLSKLVTDPRSELLGILVPIFFGLGALIFYALVFKTRLLPRFISIWGFVGVLLMGALNIFDLGDSSMFFALPIITNEIFLGIWLIAKGFNKLKIER